MKISNRVFILCVIFASLVACETKTAADVASQQAEGIALTVYKDPNCGCCSGWISYVNERGFSTEVVHPEDLNQVKVDRKIAPQYQSCHTAVSEEGFVFEGHIPAKLINRFLAEKPEGALGLAVPGMPLGSPGMEVDNRFMAYEVLLLKADGSSEIYAKVETAAEQY